MTPDSSPSDPRHVPRQPRLPVVLAVELSSKAKPGRCGVTRNASGKGLLIVTPSRFSVGDEIDVAVHVGERSGRASAKVVRVEENAKESCETWRYRLAVELDGALPEELLEEAAARAPFAKAG